MLSSSCNDDVIHKRNDLEPGELRQIGIKFTTILQIKQVLMPTMRFDSLLENSYHYLWSRTLTIIYGALYEEE